MCSASRENFLFPFRTANGYVRLGATVLVVFSAASAQADEATGVKVEETVSAEPPPAAGEPAHVTRAREAFRRGSALAKNRAWAEARASFEESERLMPHPVTRYNVALCEHALGRYAQSYRRFAELLEPAASSGAPRLPEETENRARAYLREAEQRLARVAVTVVQKDLDVRVDGVQLTALRAAADPPVFVLAREGDEAAAALPAAFELWIDPGPHTFVASRPDGRKITENHVLGVGGSTSLSLSIVDRVEKQPAAVTEPPRSMKRDAKTMAAADHTPSFVAFGIGAAGLAAGGVFAGLALGEKNALESDSRCQDQTCPAEREYIDRQDRMRLFADLATVGLGLGVAGAAAGVYFWLTAEPSGGEQGMEGAACVEPWVGLGSAGISGKF